MLVSEERERLKTGIKNQINANDGTGQKFEQWCACCGQKVVAYRHKVTWAQACALTILVDLYEEDPGHHHITNIKRVTRKRTREPDLILSHFSVMAKWDLIEDQPNIDKPDQRTSGMWKPTQAGIDYVYNRITIPKYLWVYNNRIQRETGGQIGIDRSVQEQFSWLEMQNIKRGTYEPEQPSES